MTTLFTDAGKFLDETIDSAISTVEGWFAPSNPESDPAQQIAELQKLVELMMALQAQQGAPRKGITIDQA